MAISLRERWPEGRKQQLIPYYKGLLSTYAEWHALGIGVYHGVSEDKQIPTKIFKSNSDVSKEPHMAKTGFVLGVAAKYLAVGLGFKYGGGMFV